MSGETTVYLPGPAMLPPIRAAARVADADLGAFAVIGGVAVSARLGRAHRATADVDTVVDDDRPPDAIDVPSPRPRTGRTARGSRRGRGDRGTTSSPARAMNARWTETVCG